MNGYRPLPSLMLWLLCVTLAWLTSSGLAQAQALASVNKTTVLEGETLVLRVRTRADVLELDSQPLRADFRILRQAQMSSSTLFNNTRNTFIEWELELAPRRTGQLVIPALALGNENTRPIPIQVIPMTNAQRRGLAQQVRIDVAIEDDDLYVGETTKVTLTLFYTVNVNGTFADIRPEGAEWEPVGERQNGMRRLDDGNDYRYTAFTYLYTPTRPGNLVLPEIEFNGQIRQSSWAAAQVISGLRSAPIDITVRDIPAEFPAGAIWLPATDVTLTEQWSDPSTSASVGDQQVRTTSLLAVGPAAHQLPKMQQSEPQGSASRSSVRIYPEAPILDETITSAMTRQSTRTERQAHLFTQNGTVTLPAIRVPWWDVTRDELRWASLPARTLTISGAPAPALPGAAVTPQVAPAEPNVAPSETETETGTTDINWRYWLFLLCSALIGFAVWRGLNRSTSSETEAGPHTVKPPKKAPLNTTRGGEQKSAGSESVSLQSAQQHALAHNWSPLLRTLNGVFADSGWPDCAQVARHWGVPEQADDLAKAFMATQALLYGATDAITDDDASKLSTEWQRLLARWPKRPRQHEAKPSTPPQLYPR